MGHMKDSSDKHTNKQTNYELLGFTVKHDIFAALNFAVLGYHMEISLHLNFGFFCTESHIRYIRLK